MPQTQAQDGGGNGLIRRTGRPVVVQVTAEHHIAQARQAAAAVAKTVGLAQVPVSYVATSVSELAGNLFFHARRGGTITLVPIRRGTEVGSEVGVEIIAEDQGPGIEDIELAMQDGYTTNRGLGGGLPGVRRLMDEFEIHSTRSVGTRIVARKWRPCR